MVIQLPFPQEHLGGYRILLLLIPTHKKQSKIRVTYSSGNPRLNQSLVYSTGFPHYGQVEHAYEAFR